MLPSVITKESDNSFIYNKYTNEIGCFIGIFDKGPINKPIFITNQIQFKNIFGRGIDKFANDWYQVYNYLEYSSGIYVSRCVGNDTWNAHVYTYQNNIQLSSSTDYYDMWDDIKTENGISIIATTSGESGNIINVYIADKSDYDNNIIIFGESISGIFSYFNEGYVGIVVARYNKIKENYYIKLSDLNNNTQKYKPVISKHVFIKFNNFNLKHKGLYNMNNGITQIPLISDFQDCHDVYLDKFSYVIDNFIANENAPNQSIVLANIRKDMLVFVGLPVSAVDVLTFLDIDGYEYVWLAENNIMIEQESTFEITYNLEKAKRFFDTLIKSRYTVVVNNIKKQIDGYTNRVKLLNIAGDIAGLKSQTSIKSPYLPGSGMINGKIKNIVGTHINWNKSELNEMYDHNINYIQNGCMKSQKTFTNDNSSFSRINIVALFNHIEREIEILQLHNVFEMIDEYTISKIKTNCSKILESAKYDKGITEYKFDVQTNSTNNIIDPNGIAINIYIQPTNIIEYVILQVYNNGTTKII